MRLLFVTPNPPSPIRVRPYQLARALTARGHRLTLAFPVGGAAEAADAAALAEAGFPIISAPIGPARRLLSLAGAALGSRPLQAGWAWQPRLLALLQQAMARAAAEDAQYHLAHVEHLRGAPYGLALQAHLPVAWDSVDCISALFDQTRRQGPSMKSRLLAAAELPATRRYERRLLRRFRAIAVSSPVDRAALLSLLPGGRPDAFDRQNADAEPAIAVIPNGVDLVAFQPPTAPREPATILFSGKLGYHANESAALDLAGLVMPRVWAARPVARLVLAGAQPSAALLSLAAGDPQRITVTGQVPHLAPWLQGATVAAAPLRYGVGIQNKVLEAMACATPVVATPAAAQALGVQDGRDILLADDPQQLAAAILTLLDDPARAAALGGAGRAYVQAHHSWDAAAASFERLYGGTASPLPTSPRWGEEK